MINFPGITSKMLGQMKSIKMSGLAQRLATTISQMRAEEIRAAKPFRMIMVSTAALAQVPVLLAPVAAFAVFAAVAARTGQAFDATRLFSSLSLIVLLAAPLFGTFEVVLNLYSSMACFDRIQKYLTTEDREDPCTRGVGDLQRGSEDIVSPVPASQFVPIGNEHGHQLMRIPISTETTLQKEPVSAADIHLENASFGWSRGGQFAVNRVNMTVARGQFVVLAGPVASGKSTLLKGLLGEVPAFAGHLTIAQTRTSWCEQTPWLKVSRDSCLSGFVRVN